MKHYRASSPEEHDDGPQEPLDRWVARLLASPGMLGMGHGQRSADGNLGLGWLYYGLARSVRPRRAVVIGSWRGFVPAILARAMADNLEGGEVLFIDPSFGDDFWADPKRVRNHFLGLGLENVVHHLATTQAFAQSEAFRHLGPVDLLFVDGYHTAEQARLDYETFEPCLGPRALCLFHDTGPAFVSAIYGADQAYTHSVHELIAAFRDRPELQVFDVPLDRGVALVSRRQLPSW